MLDPEFFTDEFLVANFDAWGRLFYQGLWCVAEDSWVFEPSMFALKIKIFPGDPITIKQITGWYNRFVELRKIIEYEVNGKKYAWLRKCPKWQTIDHPTPPKLPLPPWVEWHGENAVDDNGAALKRHQWHYKILEDTLNDHMCVSDVSPTRPRLISDVSPLIEVKLSEVKLSEVKRIKDLRDPSPAAQGSLIPKISEPKAPKKPKTKDTSSELFEQIWRIYPVHRDKQKATDAWRKEKLDSLFDAIRDAVERQKATKKANDAAGRFSPEFPYLHRWLKNKRWEDEVDEINSGHPGRDDGKPVYTDGSELYWSMPDTADGRTDDAVRKPDLPRGDPEGS